MGKSSNNFNQLLIYFKIEVSRNNLQLCNFRYLTWVFKIVIYLPITSNNCNNVVLLVLLLKNDTPGIALDE